FDNLTAIGGLQIGSADAFAANAALQLVSMQSLARVAGDIVIRNNSVAYVQFDKLAEVEGSVRISSSALQTLDFPELAAVGSDFDIQGGGTGNDGNAGGEIVALELPRLASVGGVLAVNNLEKLASISLPVLTEAGSIDFASVPVQFEKLVMPSLSVVNGDLYINACYVKGDFSTSTANNKLTAIDGLSDL
ncbi:MAG: hypothetical protein K2I13_00610, partial [Alistipes sp.]|nr:hypothetical protein [Alistipes sp.]